MQRLVVGGLFNDAGIDHGFECQLHARFYHGDHQYALVEVLLLADFAVKLRGGLKRGFAGLFAPGQQVLIVVGPIGHHAGGELAGDDVIHMLLEQRSHDRFQLFGERIGTQLRRVREAIHHQGDAALLQRFGDGFPAELNQFLSVGRIGTLFHQLVEAQQRARLQHTAEDSLLTHQVRFYFGNEGGLQHARTVAAGGRSPGFSDRHAFAFRIVLRVHGDQRRHTKTTLVLFTYFGARTLRGNHHHGDIFTDLLAHFHDVEAVGVAQRRAVFHQRLYGTHHVRVLLVRRQVNHQVRLRDQLFIGAYFKTVFGGFTP